MNTTDRYYPTRDEVDALMDAAEQMFGGFDRAYDRCPEFRSMLRSGIGTMGNADGFAALRLVVES